MASDLFGVQVNVLARELEGVTTLPLGGHRQLSTHTYVVLQSWGDAPRQKNLQISPSSPIAQGFSKNWVALAVVPPQLGQEQQRLCSSEQVLVSGL